MIKGKTFINKLESNYWDKIRNNAHILSCSIINSTYSGNLDKSDVYNVMALYDINAYKIAIDHKINNSNTHIVYCSDYIANEFGDKVMMLVFNLNLKHINDKFGRFYNFNISIHDYDETYVKLLSRISNIYIATHKLDAEVYKEYMMYHNQFRQKIHKLGHKEFNTLMDIESNLLDFGRQYMKGVVSTYKLNIENV